MVTLVTRSRANELLCVCAVLLLLQYFLFVVRSAPAGSSQPTPDLGAVAARAQALVQKMLGDIPLAHAAAISAKVRAAPGWLLLLLSDWLSLPNSAPSPQGLTLDSAQPTNLQVMSLSLGLPAAPPLKPPSEHFTLVSQQPEAW